MSSDFWKPLRSLTYQDVEVLKESGEREKTFLDYKAFAPHKRWIDRSDIADDIAAFANGGGGRMVFGATEKDERVVGFAGAPKEKRQGITATLRNAAHSVQPPVDIEIVDLPIPDTDTYVFVVEIRPGQRGPFQHNGRYLQRVADGNAVMPHTSVVQAVLTTERRGRDGQKVGVPVLDGNPLGPLAEGWFYGVEVVPSYETDRPIYDAFSAESDEMISWLRENGYLRIVREPHRLTAVHANHSRLELSKAGNVVVIGFVDKAVESVPLGNIVHGLGWLIRDATKSVSFFDPMFMVDIRLRVWSVGARHPLGLEWKDELGRETIRAIAASIVPIEIKLHRAVDLVDKGGRYPKEHVAITDHLTQYLKLVASAQSDGAA